MTPWTPQYEQTRWMRPSLIVQCVDVFTGLPPGDDDPLEVSLERADPLGNWREVRAAPVRNSGGVIAFRGLERRVIAAGKPPGTYRVGVGSDRYVPEYLRFRDYELVSISPWDGLSVPPHSPAPVLNVDLCPRPDYPFPQVPVARGQVVEQASGAPVPNAFVFGGINARTVTDEEGAFALPLPGVPFNVPQPIGVVDRRNRQATQNASFAGNASTQSLLFSLP